MPSIKDSSGDFAQRMGDALAAAVSPAAKRRGPARGWTNQAVWYDADDTLIAVVGEYAASQSDTALAHGLFHAQQRGQRLVLVLPRAWSAPSLYRMPWLKYDIQVWDYTTIDDVEPAATLSIAQAVNLAGGPDRTPALHLNATASNRVRELTEWATIHPELEPAHLKGLRVWSCNGMRVLTIKGNARTTITAGIDATRNRALSLTVGSNVIGKEHLAQIKTGVERGISEAKSKIHGNFDEHRLQQQLRAHPSRLRLEHPLLREVPVWRPVGGDHGPLGRGFIDLAGLDSVGDLVIVETKLGADAMLVLQGLDYWVWALRPENRDWLIERLHGDRKNAGTHLLYAVASKSGAAPVLDRYCRAHLAVLDPTVAWRMALITNWDDAKSIEPPPNKVNVHMFPPQTQPD